MNLCRDLKYSGDAQRVKKELWKNKKIFISYSNSIQRTVVESLLIKYRIQSNLFIALKVMYN